MTAVFGCLKDKAFDEMAQILFPLFETVVLTEVSSPRTASLPEMQAAAVATGTHVLTAAQPEGGVSPSTRSITPLDGLVTVTGSVYLVGELRGLLMGADS